MLVPTEAVIRTGRRALVMLALEGGRYQPAEVQLGREAGGQTEVIAGLAAGERIVTSGQFLIDSEASLAGVEARPISAASPRPATSSAAAGDHQARGRIEQITSTAVTIDHGPVPALKWPAMRMAFRVAQPGGIRGYKRGDRVRFTFDQTDQGPTLRTIQREPAR
jgi:Cu(I)/Ag(I) efflux system membrane fusion protein